MWKSKWKPTWRVRTDEEQRSHLLVHQGNSDRLAEEGFLDEDSAVRTVSVNTVDLQKQWPRIEINTGIPLLPEPETSFTNDTHVPRCIFPKGIELVHASNPSKILDSCDMRLVKTNIWARQL